MFENALWRSRSNGKCSTLTAVSISMTIILIATFFLAAVVGVFALIPAAIFLGLFIFVIVYGKKHRWENSRLIFAADNRCIYFSYVDANSYFWTSLQDILGYSIYVGDGERKTVNVYFKKPQYAGMWGKVKYIRMVNVDNVEALQKIFESNNIGKISDDSTKTN